MGRSQRRRGRPKKVSKGPAKGREAPPGPKKVGRPPKTARAKRQQAKDAPKRVFNRSSATEANEKKRREHEILGKAIKYCQDNDVGARKCLTQNPAWAGVITLQQLRTRLDGTVLFDADAEFHVRTDQVLLTREEEESLVKWLVDCNKAHDAKDNEEIGKKVREILLVRRVQNRRGGRKHVAFNKAQQNVICGNTPSQKFFTGFFSRHAAVLASKKQQNIEAKRAAVNCDAAVDEHFFGLYGLRNELIDAGIMDAETGAILDASRIKNLDETPQFVDFADNKGNAKKKFAAGKNDVCIKPKTENREVNTVTMCWSLCGMQHGLQLIVARKTLTENLAVEEFEEFDEQINIKSKYSTYGIISNTENGVQTGESFLELAKMLDKEFTAMRTPRPVVLLSDNHASRKDPKVLEFCERVGIRLFFEPSNTSGFLQALDQYNKKFHEAYKKQKNLYKEMLPPGQALNTADFVRIVAQMWPCVCDVVVDRTVPAGTGPPRSTASTRSARWASCRTDSHRRTSTARSS